jgi:hypothetical protein
MKQTFAAIAATVAGLVLLLDFKTHSARLSAPLLATAASSAPTPET